MSRLEWDLKRPYELGLDRGVLYSTGGVGYAWSGLLSVNENVEGKDDRALYFDGIKYAITTSVEDLSLSLSAFTYPPQFDNHNGSNGIFDNQQRLPFGLSYRVKTTEGYKIHIVYNALAGPAPKASKSMGGPVDISPLTWLITSVPTEVVGAAPSAHLVIDTAVAYPEVLTALEDILYGSSSTNARLPTVQEVISLATANPRLIITDNGDGTWTATGPDDAIKVDGDFFEITWPTAIFIGPGVYELTTS